LEVDVEIDGLRVLSEFSFKIAVESFLLFIEIVKEMFAEGNGIPESENHVLGKIEENPVGVHILQEGIIMRFGCRGLLFLLVFVVLVIDEDEEHVDEDTNDQEVEQGVEEERERLGILEHGDGCVVDSKHHPDHVP
jgi:hypothetical protein